MKRLSLAAAVIAVAALPGLAMAEDIPRQNSPGSTSQDRTHRETTTGAVGTNRDVPSGKQDHEAGRSSGRTGGGHVGTGSSSAISVDPNGPNAPKDDVQTDSAGRLRDTSGNVDSNTAVKPDRGETSPRP